MDKKIIEEIKNKNNIVEVISEQIDLIKKGRNYWAVCPFHEDTNPSMSVSPEKQMFKCFVCGASGDAFSFLMKYKNIPYMEAVKQLGAKANIDVKVQTGRQVSEKERNAYKAMKDAFNFFNYNLNTKEGKVALDYLKERQIDNKLIEEFSLGYASNGGLKDFMLSKGYEDSLLVNLGLINERGGDFFRNRVIFSIKNNNGDIVGFSGRTLDKKDKSKYINSPETFIFKKSNILYNFWQAKDVMLSNKEIFINEGFMDVIAMNKAGIKNSIAIMGTALTRQHIPFLKNNKINLMLDGDNAGINATVKSILLLLEMGKKVFVVENNTGKDPDEILTNQGIEGLIKITENKIEGIEFIYVLHKKKYGKITSENINGFIASFRKYLIHLDPTTQNMYFGKIAKLFNLEISVVKEAFNFTQNNSNQNSYQRPSYQQERPSYQQAPKQVEKSSENKRNFTYELILSLIKNHKDKAFIDKFKELYASHKIFFYDHVYLTIVNSIICFHDNKEKPKIDKEYKAELVKIQKYDRFITDVDNLEELVANVNEYSKKEIKDKIRLKLEDKSLTDEQRVDLLEKLKGLVNNG